MAGRCRVLFSLSVYETPLLVSRLLQNLLSMVAADTRIVVHVGNLSWPEQDLHALQHVDVTRILLNPQRIATRHRHGSVLASQVSNVLYAESLGILPQHVVFAPSNMLWCRTHVEEYVQGQMQSVPSVKSMADCKRWNSAPPRTDMRRCMRGVLPGKYYASKVWPLMKRAWPTLEYSILTKHEGSFYPWKDVLNVSHSVPTELFDTPGYLEEVVFQSWVANFGSSAVNTSKGSLMASSLGYRVHSPTVRQLLNNRSSYDERLSKRLCDQYAWDQRSPATMWWAVK